MKTATNRSTADAADVAKRETDDLETVDRGAEIDLDSDLEADPGPGTVRDGDSKGRLKLPSMRESFDGMSITATPMLIIIGVLVVAIGATAIVLHRSNSGYDDRQAAREAAIASANATVPSLLTYDAETVARLGESQAEHMTSAFAKKYAKLVTEELVPAAAKRRLVTQTEVASTSVVSGDVDQMTLLMFLNQATLAEGMKTPAATGSRVRVVMVRAGGTWKIDKLTPL